VTDTKKSALMIAIERGGEEREKRIKDKALSLLQLFREQGSILEQMTEEILKAAKELGISAKELEEEIKRITQTSS